MFSKFRLRWSTWVNMERNAIPFSYELLLMQLSLFIPKALPLWPNKCNWQEREKPDSKQELPPWDIPFIFHSFLYSCTRSLPGWRGGSMNWVIQIKFGHDQKIQSTVWLWFELLRISANYCDIIRKNAFMSRICWTMQNFATMVRWCNDSKLCDYDQTKLCQKKVSFI